MREFAVFDRNWKDEDMPYHPIRVKYTSCGYSGNGFNGLLSYGSRMSSSCIRKLALQECYDNQENY